MSAAKDLWDQLSWSEIVIFFCFLWRHHQENTPRARTRIWQIVLQMKSFCIKEAKLYFHGTWLDSSTHKRNYNLPNTDISDVNITLDGFIFSRSPPSWWIFFLLSSCYISHMQSNCKVHQCTYPGWKIGCYASENFIWQGDKLRRLTYGTSWPIW